ncbi:MAG: 1-acyl-sn-glycerol-3-phosphate acyltransferase [Nitrospinae bacterium]|nr:1-acyl-sn-glycerol-3-phosphate acyltransferase [Nitrospinota bacterium]MBL7019517.1 1-acyl-sn-glycerol-3-phosphate acyltransferase [Nitrospinaceae bacterium]
MGYCFAVIRTGAYAGVFIVFVLIGAFGHVLFFMSPPRLLKWIAFFAQRWARMTCMVLNIQVRIVGDTSIKPGSLIVANHVGSPDIFVLGASFKGFFVSKAEIADWPLFNWLARLGKTVFADRSKRHQVKTLIREIEQRLNSDHCVILFPEAQATDGTDVVPFKSAVFEAAILANRPVVPVEIRYHDDHRPTIAYYGDSFISHIMTLLKAPRLLATLTVLPEITAGVDRQTLAEKSYKAIHDKHMSNKVE